MEKLLLKNIADNICGELINPKEIYIDNITTDTRKLCKNSLFVALKGDNFDGHNFIENAYEKGVVCVVSEKKLNTDNPYILVKDTKVGLRDIAEYYRSLFNIPFVAVTGSSGKTTTKDVIASVLSRKFKTLKTQGNFNNEIGVPLTIFNLDNTYECAVIEMGMNNFGEIHNLSKIVKPDIAVITNVGVAHLENLGSREGILEAKCEIFHYLKKDGVKIVNGDCDMLSTLEDVEFFAIDNKADYYATNIKSLGLEGIFATLNYKDEKIDVKIPYPGKYMVLNALTAFAVGKKLGLTNDEIKDGIENTEKTKMRFNVIKRDNYTVINDCYNANPDSVKSAIDILTEAEGKKVAVLGDMFELGENEKHLHYQTGIYTANSNIDKIVLIGELSYNTYLGAKDANKTENVYYFKNQEDFFKEKDNILEKNDIILVKASRGMKFEKTVEELTR